MQKYDSGNHTHQTQYTCIGSIHKKHMRKACPLQVLLDCGMQQSTIPWVRLDITGLGGRAPTKEATKEATPLHQYLGHTSIDHSQQALLQHRKEHSYHWAENTITKMRGCKYGTTNYSTEPVKQIFKTSGWSKLSGFYLFLWGRSFQLYWNEWTPPSSTKLCSLHQRESRNNSE